MVLKLPSQCEIRPLRAGKHHYAARIAVKAMHHPRTLNAADTCHIGKVLQQNVAQRSVGMSRRAMHYHARRLVDDDYVAISMDDLDRYVTPPFHLLL